MPLPPQIFTSGTYGFSFQYPPDFNITEVDENNGGNTILAEGTNKKSFQIFIAPFDEQGSITPERIKKDLPGVAIENPQNVLIAGKTITALLFFGKGENLTRTREIWFVKNGNLYQVTAYDNMDSVVGPLLESLRFE